MIDSQIMFQAAAEIRGMRRRLEVLEAKDRVFEGMMAALHATPAYPGMGASEDVAWKLEKRAAELKEEEGKVASLAVPPTKTAEEF